MAKDTFRKIDFHAGAWVKQNNNIEKQILYWEEKNAIKTCVLRMQAGATLGSYKVYIGADIYVLEGELQEGKETIQQGIYAHFPALATIHISAKKNTTFLLIMYGPVESEQSPKQLL